LGISQDFGELAEDLEQRRLQGVPTGPGLLAPCSGT
jgi:hypothetical protein